MSIEQVDMYRLRCDGCGVEREWWDDETVALFSSPEETDRFAQDDGWTTDGEGKHHCDDCERLELTEEAKASAARKLGPGDVPLIEVA